MDQLSNARYVGEVHHVQSLLDWKRIAPHLSRVFTDYKPGIHYPQTQMQAGTTEINATRVYHRVKQGKDHVLFYDRPEWKRVVGARFAKML